MRSVELELPVLDGPPVVPPPVFHSPAARDDADHGSEEQQPPVIRRIEHDSVGRRTRVVTSYGSNYLGPARRTDRGVLRRGRRRLRREPRPRVGERPRDVRDRLAGDDGLGGSAPQVPLDLERVSGARRGRRIRRRARRDTGTSSVASSARSPKAAVGRQARMQAARCPSETPAGARSSGSVARQALDRDRAAGVEAATGRHVDRVRRLAAQDLGSTRWRGSRRGTTESSAFVYGWRGSSITCRAGPSSTMRPRYITQMRSAKRAAVERSWVIIEHRETLSRSSSRMREDPGAHRDIEHRDRLVGDEQLRAERRGSPRSRRADAGRRRARGGKRSRNSSAGASPTCSSARVTASRRSARDADRRG